MKSLFFTCLLLVLYGKPESVMSDYLYNSQRMNWTAAKNYCRENHGTLASFTSEEEYEKCVLLGTISPAWIGLTRTAPHVNIWKWPNGEITNFTKWKIDEPNDKGTGEDCVAVGLNGWVDASCLTGNFTTICSRGFILVKEKKTWEEALQHCRTHFTDLAFVNTEQQLGYFRTLLTIENQADSVWTGLRFRDGKWFWVNGVAMGSLVSRPQCPIRPYHCGSYNFNASFWKNRDCNEKVNFVCY